MGKLDSALVTEALDFTSSKGMLQLATWRKTRGYQKIVVVEVKGEKEHLPECEYVHQATQKLGWFVLTGTGGGEHVH